MYGQKARSLNLKNMKETLVNYCGGDRVEFGDIWDGFIMMRHLGFISDDTWNKFYVECGSWTIDGDFLVDADNGEVIFDFDNARNGGEYKAYRA